MNTEMLRDHIRGVRKRLADLQVERASVAPNDYGRKADLIDEEMTLEALLAELRDRVTHEMDATTRTA